MKLIDALKITQQVDGSENGTLKIALVCGFTPLHLRTFLHAQLQLLFPDQRVEITAGLYGDIAGTLKRVKEQPVDAVALVLEWEDLDARLGTRQLGGWVPRNLEGVVEQVGMRLSHLQGLVEELCRSKPVIICLPTLPLPPLFLTAGWQSSQSELRIRELVASFGPPLAKQERVRFVNEQRLACSSPPSQRLDVGSYWLAGFPYHLSHASALAELLALLIQNPLPRKGLVTDLDDTLWSGIVGDVGAQGVHWDLDHHAQGHGLYQQLLRTLSEEGILVAVASRNDPSVVEEAFQREDLLLPKEKVFPIEVGWGSKAAAISRILNVWNVGPQSVVFIDDNPLELAEVQAAHSQLLCVRFPQREPQAIYDLLIHLRDLFGKNRVSLEDELRLESIRGSAILRDAGEDSSEGFSEALLERADAELTLSLRKDASDSRALELINKTNQFNLNGQRFTEAAWQDYLGQKDTFLLTASYKDRFGSLGKIAVITGRRNGTAVSVESWVMSCRAFSRRIEYQCLRFLFDTFKSSQITFNYHQTPRNGPVRSFFAAVLQDPFPAKPTVSNEDFTAVCPKLFHRVRELKDE